MVNVTDPQEEIFPVVDFNDKVVGKIIRSKAHKSPEITHRAAGAFIYNSNNEILIQKRSVTKDTFPDCWDISVGGHVEYGDDYMTTIIREVYEEIGVRVKADELTLLGKLLIKLPWEQEFWQIYRYNMPKESGFQIEKFELSETKFVKIDKLKEMLDDSGIKWSEKARQQFNKLLFNK